MELFEKKYFESERIIGEDGKAQMRFRPIEKINKNLDEINAEDVVFMSNALLRKAGHFHYNPAFINPRDGDSPDWMELTFTNIPKSTIQIYGYSKNYDFHRLMEGMLKNIGQNKLNYHWDSYIIEQNIRSMIEKPLPLTNINIGTPKFEEMMRAEFFFEYGYSADNNHNITMQKGEWLNELTESYNGLVENHTLHHKGMDPHCTIMDYWSNPKHITEDDTDWYLISKSKGDKND